MGIRCGEYNVKEEHEIFSSQESRVEEVHFHPQYDPRTVKNNFAIVRTKENFLYQEHIGPTCLPRPNESFESPRKSRDCWSSGWGADFYEETALYSDGLRKVKLPVVPRDECEKRLGSTDRFAGRGFRLHESWMCIGGTKGNDTCRVTVGLPMCARLNVAGLRSEQWLGVLTVAMRCLQSTHQFLTPCAGLTGL